MTTQVILVTAATGKQSSNLIRALSQADSPTPITIHALTRDPTSASAQSLLSYGHPKCEIKLYKADFDDIQSLEAAAAGATSAVINVTPSFSDNAAERRHANNVISALVSAASSTMRRIVYTSANLPPREELINVTPGSWMDIYSQSKLGIQDDVTKVADEKGWEWSIIHPATFLTNFLPPDTAFMYPKLKTTRRIVTAYSPEFKLSAVVLEDLGRFIADSLTWTGEKFDNKFKSKIVPFANEILTFDEIIEGLNAQLRRDPKSQGVQVEVVHLTKEEAEKVRDSDPFTAGILFVMDNMKAVDIEKVKSYGFTLSDVKSFWERESDRVRATVGLE